jgi:hypothetical protein
MLSLLSRRVPKTSQSAAGRPEAGQSFGGGELVAAEETRSGAGGDHAKMPAWHGGGAGVRTARSLAFHPHCQVPLHPKVTTAAFRTSASQPTGGAQKGTAQEIRGKQSLCHGSVGGNRRVPHVRLSVRGPKTMGAAQRSLSLQIRDCVFFSVCSRQNPCPPLFPLPSGAVFGILNHDPQRR